ncbi:putative dehydrogenase [Gaiella occulta]|uniref:Putative dehydrogenase n=1 Tax=Gaiella occulta TaxID=1002870 RepID=A0A7M2YUF6_9ACTN|nr:Gfo/Idh/MocA family oxidoreductase [Gaiella occulta]RDI73635.1 putative dehydrogenase [Gaiella occulta]
MTDLLGVAVCGTGNAGVEHLREFAALPNAEVRAIVDLDLDRAASVAHDLGLDCPVYASLSDTFAGSPVDAVVVASPNDVHASMTVEAVRHGAHVLLEKPAAITHDDLDLILEEVRRAGVLCQVNMILRWHPMIEAIVGARDAGNLGEIFCVEADFVFGEIEGSEPDWARTVARGGNVHLYAGCHAYDQLEWLAGSRITEVSAVSTRRRSKWEYDVTACTIVRFANGAIGRATITLEASAPYRFGIRVMGTKGTVVDNTICIPARGAAHFDDLCPERVDVTYLPFDRVAADFTLNALERHDSHAALEHTADLFRLALDSERAAQRGEVVKRT